MGSRGGSGVDRRSFLGVLAAGAAVASAPFVLTGTTRLNLKPGTGLRGGWTVDEVKPVEAGAMRVIASHTTGRRAQVAVCKTELGSKAMASAGEFDLFLMNDGQDGKVRTPDDEVRMVEDLASILKRSSVPTRGLRGREERNYCFDPNDHLEPNPS